MIVNDLSKIKCLFKFDCYFLNKDDLEKKELNVEVEVFVINLILVEELLRSIILDSVISGLFDDLVVLEEC